MLSNITALAQAKREQLRDDEAQGQKKKQAGFTLIELMVVLLIIGILMAIAIPTYLSERNKANNTAAESTVRNALTALNAVYATQNYYGLPAGSSASSFSAYMQTQEPSLTWSSSAVSAINDVSIVTGNSVNSGSGTASDQGVEAVAWAPDGKCFYALALQYPLGGSGGTPGAGTYYYIYAPAHGASSCTASFPSSVTLPTAGAAPTNGDWGNSWATTPTSTSAPA